jgi:hypothetical protein
MERSFRHRDKAAAQLAIALARAGDVAQTDGSLPNVDLIDQRLADNPLAEGNPLWALTGKEERFLTAAHVIVTSLMHAAGAAQDASEAYESQHARPRLVVNG